MDRNREARRARFVGSNGFNRRRHRTNSLRDFPDEDGGLELQESVRLRDRVKKDRDRERERDRDLRDRSSRSKRRRAERLTSNRDYTRGDETSEESMNDDEGEEDGESTGGATAVRFSSPVVGSISHNHHQNHHVHVNNHQYSHSSSFSQQLHNSNIVSCNNHHLQHRKTFPPSSMTPSAAWAVRAPPVWKSGDEMISLSVPRKARSASRRSHDWISSSSNNNSGGGVSGGGDQNPAQPSTSPARQSHMSTSTAPPPAHPMSPSSSNASIRKKLKHSGNNTAGPKFKPPKVSSSKPSSSNPEELEFEIAEVLYGLMTQSQGPSSSKKEDSREVNRLYDDAKSLNSSPISNPTSNNNPILGPNCSPLSAVAPKRKRPRQVPENSSYGAWSSPISAKPDTDQMPKSEISSPNLDKISGSGVENGCEMGDNSVIPQGRLAELPVPPALESAKPESELKPAAKELREGRDLVVKQDVSLSKEQESAVVRAQDSNDRDSPSMVTVSSVNLTVSEIENQKEEKFEIDLMAPPPQVRMSPGRETKIDSKASAAVAQKPVLSTLDRDLEPVLESAENGHLSNVANEEKKCKEAESNKGIENRGMNIDLGGLDLEKPGRDVSSRVNVDEHKSKLQTQKPLKAPKEEPSTEKPGHSTSSSPLPMSMASWPGGLPTMGYMTPLQGVVPVDGSSVAPAHIQKPLFSQPRPKRCATHCHIARNIHCLQQFMKMNPFWPASAGPPSSLFGSKPCNLNVVPTSDLNMSARGVNSAQDKGQSLASIPNNGGREKSSQPATNSDPAQRKQQQILIQQALPPVAPSNLLGPTFIFPLNHQQQAAMAARPTTAKPPTTTAASPNTTPTPAATTSSSAPTPMSFNYPNMSPNETQYLAILQNNAYTFPIPTVGGAPAPNYRGGPTHAMPLFNGPFYSSQIIPQQLQHSQQQLPKQPPQMMQAHHNATTSSNSSSSQKHVQSHQQQRPQSSGNASLQNNFSQKVQHLHNQYMHAGEDSQPTNDNRGTGAPMNIYGQNFALPIHPQNLALMTPPPAALASASNNQNEKKSHQSQQQQQRLKTGVESLPPHTFAMSFGPINGTPAGIAGIGTSMAQNHAAFQDCTEAARQSTEMMAVAAQLAQKNFQVSEDNGKSGNIASSSKEDRRKSFAFTRSDLGDTPVASIQANTVIESSSRSLTVGSGSTRNSRPPTTNGMMGPTNVVPNAHVQAQQQQQQQILQLKQQQQQHMAANAVNRNKAPGANKGGMYSEHLNSSSMAGPKFPNSISPFPQNHLVHGNSTSTSQSPQWKSSTRTPGPQGPSVSAHKNIAQQHSRTQHAQISFCGNQKQQSAPSQGQQAPLPSSSNQVGSPTTSSVSKGTSGSPRTASSASTNNKMSHTSSFSVQPAKNGQSMPAQKPPSILGNPHGAKSQVQQAQLFFSNPYSQSHSPHSTSTSLGTACPSGYYMQQRRSDQLQRASGGPVTSSSGVLSLCSPVSMSNTSTNDPATAIAAATCNVKGGGLQSQGVIHGSPFGGQSTGMMLPAGFSYVHPVQAGVHVKPAEQKHPVGNDNFQPSQPEKK